MGTATGSTGAGEAEVGAEVRCCRGVAAYSTEAGGGKPLPGLIPVDGRTSLRMGGAAMTGAVANALPFTATRLFATGLRPANTEPDTAVTAPGAFVLT